MSIVQIISEHRRIPRAHPVTPGCKRVMAIVKIKGGYETRHIDINAANEIQPNRSGRVLVEEGGEGGKEFRRKLRRKNFKTEATIINSSVQEMNPGDITLKCQWKMDGKVCSQEYLFSKADQDSFAQKVPAWPAPKFCKEHRAARKAAFESRQKQSCQIDQRKE